MIIKRANDINTHLIAFIKCGFDTITKRYPDVFTEHYRSLIKFMPVSKVESLWIEKFQREANRITQIMC